MSLFECEQDPDIESFLQNRAIDFENLSKGRTYLLFDEKMLASENFSPMGYFTITVSALEFADSVSIRQRKRLDGFSGKKGNEPIRSIPVYLIGQLGKNSAYPGTPISGSELIDYAMSVIRKAHEMVAGNTILVESKPLSKLETFYKENGFDFFSSIKSPHDENRMNQYIRVMNNS